MSLGFPTRSEAALFSRAVTSEYAKRRYSQDAAHTSSQCTACQSNTVERFDDLLIFFSLNSLPLIVAQK